MGDPTTAADAFNLSLARGYVRDIGRLVLPAGWRVDLDAEPRIEVVLDEAVGEGMLLIAVAARPGRREIDMTFLRRETG